MENQVKKDLFNIFQEEKDMFRLYEKVLEYIPKLITDVKAIENVRFYNVLAKLSYSINNAGWEDRHSEQIDFLNKEVRYILDNYEEYLP